nr:V-type Ig domain protein [Oriental turtle dovepox virus]
MVINQNMASRLRRVYELLLIGNYYVLYASYYKICF